MVVYLCAARRTVYIAVHGERLVLLCTIHGYRSTICCETETKHQLCTSDTLLPGTPKPAETPAVNSKYWALGISQKVV